MNPLEIRARALELAIKSCQEETLGQGNFVLLRAKRFEDFLESGYVGPMQVDANGNAKPLSLGK